MHIIYVLWLREMRRFIRSRAQLAASLSSPVLYLIVLGFGLGPVFAAAGRGDYLQFVVPGLVGMTILFNAMFAGMSLLWDRQFGIVRATLVAPVPRLQIVAGRTLGGATVAVAQGAILLLLATAIGFRPDSLGLAPLGAVYMTLIAIVFVAIGTAIGARLSDVHAFQLVTNFVMMPLFFLSGALFPLDQLPAALTLATRLDPLTYGVDGLRAAFGGTAHFSVATSLSILGAAAVAAVLVGARSFSRIEI
jgi:ABC-2 type transport system permease protein